MDISTGRSGMKRLQSSLFTGSSRCSPRREGVFVRRSVESIEEFARMRGCPDKDKAAVTANDNGCVDNCVLAVRDVVLLDSF
jgi:hypothetical protein